MSQVERTDAPLDTETLRRTARAEVARLSLAVRVARQEAEQREHEAAEAKATAEGSEAFLRESLEALIAERRERQDAELVEAREAAAQVVEDARRRIASVREASARRADAEETRLRVVGADERTGSGAADGQPRIVALDAPALVSRDELRELVQAAVVAALAEATDRAVATMRMAPTIVDHFAPVPPQYVTTPAVAEATGRSFWRELAHLDVLLPLVAAIIVVLVVLAWVG